MDFDIFCKCFKTLVVYHKANTYSCNTRFSDLKKIEKIYLQQTPQPAPAAQSTNYDERTPHYLFVDNLKPTEIVVSFASLSRWNEPPPGQKDSHGNLKGRIGELEKESSNLGAASVSDEDTHSQRDGLTEVTFPPIVPGTLVIEPHSWKTLEMGHPILRLRTTATKAAMMILPAGRHVLKLSMSSPLGHHVQLCSTTQFVFGDEETVMPHLTKESCRFIDQANQVIQAIGKCITNFHDDELFTQAWLNLIDVHCPHKNLKTVSKTEHFALFNDSMYGVLKKYLGELLTPEMAFAWRVFNYDVTSPNILGLPYGTSRPATGATSHRGSAKPGKKQPEKLDTWANREPTPEEHVATIKIQRYWRGFYVRKVKLSRMAGSEDNIKVQELLMKAWNVLEQNPEEKGLMLFRTMFKADPDLMARYPFHKDEWNKISYSDYQGTYPDQPANTWFIVFREVFFVTEEMLVVPKLYVTIPTCLLRVVNNDTGEEIPKVFQKVAPYVYKRNKLGYTFVAEARTTDLPLPSGKWRMRLIGSLTQLPAPAKNEVNSSFNMRELRDYYVPNKNNVILRHTVKNLDDHLASIQLTTSKNDVYIKLQILDNDIELATATGKGHVVIPAFIFQKDVPSEEDKRSSSRSSNKPPSRSGSRNRHADSAKSHSSPCSHHSAEGDEEKPHKYLIQATVLRNSWPLSESQWTFAQHLLEHEKNDMKLSQPQKDRVQSASKLETKAAAPAPAAAKGKGKGAKEKGGKEKDKDKGSRPPSQQFDIYKPHWILRFVSDGTAAEDVDVKRDTERIDEIRAMKKAWEDAEPGRAAKAMQSRLQYLSTHLIKLIPDVEGDGEEKKDSEMDVAESAEALDIVPSQTPISCLETVESDTVLSNEPPPPAPPKDMLQPLDLTPFVRRLLGVERYKDEVEIERQLAERQQEIQNYRSFRESVEEWRENDRKHRNTVKREHLQKYEDLQALLDKKRSEVLEPREAYRQKFLEAERLRLEAIAAQEAALREEQEKLAPSPKGKKGSAKGKKKK